MKVATIFFGISRAATLTRDSIQKNLFLLPQNSTLTFTSFASLNLPKKFIIPVPVNILLMLISRKIFRFRLIIFSLEIKVILTYHFG
jgi:hypothetical protein